MILFFQIGTIFLATVLAFLLPNSNRGRLHAFSRGFARLAARRRLATVISGLIGVSSSVFVAIAGGIAVPQVEDEFSYLLAADTFAHGRTVNPSHPMWVHFETYHVIVHPVYAPKYPPLQGLVLAFGKVVFGHPIVGAWLSMGLASAAVCWMLQAWAPPRWGLLGGLLIGTHVSFVPFWGNGYMGGALAMTGGALVYGALRRLLRTPRVTSAVIMAIGLVILATTRPFEGLLVSLPALATIAICLIGPQRWPTKIAFQRLILPALAIFVPVGALVGYYNFRVTGSPIRLPYMAYEEQYSIVPLFFVQAIRPAPEYHHVEIQTFHQGWIKSYQDLHTLAGLGDKVSLQYFGFWYCYVGPVLTIPLLLVASMWRDRPIRLVLAAICLTLIGLIFVVWINWLYLAPAGGLIELVVVQGLRRLRVIRFRGRPAGRFLTSSLVIIYLLSFGILLALQYGKRVTADPEKWPNNRARLLDDLQSREGKHLVVVFYEDGYNNVVIEWVYNEADIDDAKVVWARGMDDEHNQTLLDYFRDRRVWALYVNNEGKKVKLEEIAVVRPTANPQQ